MRTDERGAARPRSRRIRYGIPDGTGAVVEPLKPSRTNHDAEGRPYRAARQSRGDDFPHSSMAHATNGCTTGHMPKGVSMLRYAIIFFVIALIAAVLGF